MGKKLKREFYIRSTLEVAKDLLGKVLVKKEEGSPTLNLQI